jgi:DNA modification methylase
MSTQSSLNLSAKQTGPVECLGQTFPSDDTRREHYLNLLAEKLKDPEFRKIEGFPIGEDEDILALSDPPYYTACPNPWIGDFINHYGRPYDPKEKYHREPFAADVSEGKNHPIYNAHSYHTKVPHRAIMRYILHYTEPGDIVFDGFCGTGMTGVAAQLCGDRVEVQELGYKVDSSGSVFGENGVNFTRIGGRLAILNELAPAATFISNRYNSRNTADSFDAISRFVINNLKEKYELLYQTSHGKNQEGIINYTVWSDVFSCPECASQFSFWDVTVDLKSNTVYSEFPCPECDVILTKKVLDQVYESQIDPITEEPVSVAKQVPVLINYRVNTTRYEKIPDAVDLARLADAKKALKGMICATNLLPDGYNLRQPKESHRFLRVHQFYQFRTLLILSDLYKYCLERYGNEVHFLMGSILPKLTKMNRYMRQHGSRALVGPMSNALYVPSISVENNVIDQLDFQRKKIVQAVGRNGKFLISTQSSTKVAVPDNSVDYIFVDPPFGGNIMYSDMSFLREAWLKLKTNTLEEAIENPNQGKGIEDYRQLMIQCFRESFRILKPGRWITVEFSNTKAAVWNALQSTLQECGFVVAGVAALDKLRGGFHAMTSPTAVKQDLVISAYKPNGGLEERFHKSGHTVEGVWDFMRTHLRNLPVVKPRGGELEFIAERDPRILYDRMVAFYVGHGVPVPLSSAEFQAALAEKFPEREGMFFLPEQVSEWDKKRAQMEGVGQMSIFVEDEKSAIDWLRNHLKSRPSTYQDIQPEFMQQLGASWKKFETRPELSLLLEQNFLKYDGKGEVPSQIHSYLSTQNKDLRNLSKDDTRLQARAKDRWFVPDPAKAVDVEAVRNKRLLQEFWELCTEAGIARPSGSAAQRILPLVTSATAKKSGRRKLKEVRTEAVRLGFQECFKVKDYTTILAIAEHLPANVIEEDEQLQMMHDMAEMRTIV